MRPFEAALKGAREIGFTIVSITFSLIAVFIPVLLMGGMVGRVFREFAVTIAVAIIVSGFVSLTLTPMLCARVLRAHHEGEQAEHRAARRSRRCSRSGCAATNGRLIRVLAIQSRDADGHAWRRWRATVWLYIVDPEGLLPDRGYRLHLRLDRRRRRISRSTRWSICSGRSPRSSAPIRRSPTSIPRSAPAGRTRR